MKTELDIFFRKIAEMLSVIEDDILKDEYLKEICSFFGFSHAFIYEADYTGKFNRSDYYQIENVKTLKSQFDIRKELGTELFSELTSKRYIISTASKPNTGLESKLNKLFNASIFVLIPILNQHLELAGFVGLSDRRKEIRGKDYDIKNACVALTLIANQVKIDLFKKGIDNAQKVLNNVLDHVGIDIYVNDYYTHDVLYVNKSMAAPYGGVEAMLGKKCWGTIFSDKEGQCDFCPQPKLIDETGYPNNTYTWDYERAMDGSWFRVLSSSIPWTDGRIAHIVASVDITESKKNQLLIEKLAQFDYLTGLPNRRSLQDDVELFIKDKSAFGDQWYVLFCDLDGFKKVNDTLGHSCGDILLKAISNELKKLQSDSLRVYRQGGDEFVVIVRDPHSADEVKELLGKLMKIFSDTYKYQKNDMKCGCSIGVAHYPSNATRHKELFHAADIAMYAAKKVGGCAVRFFKDNEYLEPDEYFFKKDK